MPAKTIQDYTHCENADGELILVSSLSEEHLRNAIKFVANCLCSYCLSNYAKPFNSGEEITKWLGILLQEANQRYDNYRPFAETIVNCLI